MIRALLVELFGELGAPCAPRCGIRLHSVKPSLGLGLLAAQLSQF